MSESVFDSFIESVYNGGSAISLFDGYVGGLEVVGGADDITVESIFGGKDLSSSDVDDSEEEKDMRHYKTEIMTTGGEPAIVSNLNISIGGNVPDTTESNDGGTTEETNVREIIDDYETLFTGGTVSNEEPIIDQMNLSLNPSDSAVDIKKSEGLSAHEVAGMLSTYR